jgi:hypothetical protein
MFDLLVSLSLTVQYSIPVYKDNSVGMYSIALTFSRNFICVCTSSITLCLLLSMYVYFCTLMYILVSEHMGWVRNVLLMNVYFGSGKSQGVGISGGEGPDGQMGEMQESVYEQPKEEVDRSCHSMEGSK